MENLSLGAAIKRLRTAGGLSQTALASTLAVDPTYVSHLEAGRRDPSIKILRKLAQVLDVPPGLLIAIALATELPPDSREPYANILDGLVEIASIKQLRLQLG